MSATAASIPSPPSSTRPTLDSKPSPVTAVIFIALLVAGIGFSAYSLIHDVGSAGPVVTTWLPYVLLGVALLIALGFEFVNGFHDTANAVATVIYTHSLPANFAVIWSGFFNFLGVLVSSGAVAFGIISLLPVELILQVGSSAGFAMVFALLIAATGRRRSRSANRCCSRRSSASSAPRCCCLRCARWSRTRRSIASRAATRRRRGGFAVF
jgi:inorganic phosphate transporter, PiT family